MELNDIQQAKYSETSTTQIGNDQDRRFINHLFKKLFIIFPASKVHYDKPEVLKEAKREWMEALIENDVRTPEQFKKGLEFARKETKPFMPSIGQFIEWCNGGNQDNVIRPPFHLFEPDVERLALEQDGSKKVSAETRAKDMIKIGLHKESDYDEDYNYKPN